MNWIQRIATAVLVAAMFAPQASLGSEFVSRLSLPNGIDATVFSAAYLESRTILDGTRGIITLDSGEYLTVVTDIDDPLIQNKGDGRFHRFEEPMVLELLDEIELADLALPVEIYVLPFPRTNVLMSSASGSRVFLSPQVLEITRERAAYVISHELGHVFQNKYLPGAHNGWAEYKRLRGIEDASRFNDTAPHAYRPKEIFAEDFRVLFGGPSAFFGGNIENTEIASPIHIPHLEPFFFGLLDAVPGSLIAGIRSYPNPFNPETEIHVQVSPSFLASGEPLSIQIYDVAGALVRDLYQSPPGDLDVQVRWDGRNENGDQVASAAYFGVARAGQTQRTHKLLMIK